MVLPALRRRERAIPAQWHPFSEFEDLYDRMGRLLESSFAEPAEASMWTPLADVSETEEAYIVEAEVPGIAKDDIDIQVSGNEIAITGRTEQQEEEGKRAHRRGRRYGRFEYRAMLPGDISADKVSAALHNGVLTVTIPKSEKVKPRRIAIS